MRDPSLRVQPGLAAQPEVQQIAERLRLHPDEVVGKWIRVLGWARGATRDGHTFKLRTEDVDCFIEVAGFAEALRAVGWLVVEEDALVLPGFGVYFVRPVVKKKWLRAERQKRYRQRLRDKAKENLFPEPKPEPPKPKPEPARVFQESFERFWKAYPKKKSKGDALKAWLSLRPDDSQVTLILSAVERAKKQHSWLKDGGQFIPYPATWLRAKGWEDEFDGSQRVGSTGRVQSEPGKYAGVGTTVRRTVPPETVPGAQGILFPDEAAEAERDRPGPAQGHPQRGVG